MRAILLAAGLGTRLRPLTDQMPKCLVPVKGKPLLQIWLERLSVVGVSEFLINTHYLADQVHDFLERTSYRVTCSHESELLGTAGTLNKNRDFLAGEDAFLVHADNYCLADFSAFMKAHQSRPSECCMTMMTFRTQQPQQCGIVEVNSCGVVESFHEKVKNPPGNLANGAVYILAPEALGDIPQTAKDLSTEVLPKLIGRIQTYETKEPFIDIGTPENYQFALTL